MQLSQKQNEYIINATHRWNIKSGAVRSGKSFVDTAYIVPKRIRDRAGKPGLNVIMGVSKESIERNVLQPMREIYTSDLMSIVSAQKRSARLQRYRERPSSIVTGMRLRNGTKKSSRC